MENVHMHVLNTNLQAFFFFFFLYNKITSPKLLRFVFTLFFPLFRRKYIDLFFKDKQINYTIMYYKVDQIFTQ